MSTQPLPHGLFCKLTPKSGSESVIKINFIKNISFTLSFRFFAPRCYAIFESIGAGGWGGLVGAGTKAGYGSGMVQYITRALLPPLRGVQLYTAAPCWHEPHWKVQQDEPEPRAVVWRLLLDGAILCVFFFVLFYSCKCWSV